MKGRPAPDPLDEDMIRAGFHGEIRAGTLLIEPITEDSLCG